MATLYQGPKKSGNCCQIFIHNVSNYENYYEPACLDGCHFQPAIPVQEFNPTVKLPDLTVEGDVMLKEFNFMVDNKIDRPVKIGRVGLRII